MSGADNNKYSWFIVVLAYLSGMSIGVILSIVAALHH